MTATIENTKLLAIGFGQLLGAADIGLTWDDDAAYSDSDTGMWIGQAPLEVGRCVAIMPYPLSRHPVLTENTTGVQFIARADTLFDAWAIADAIDQYLRGRFPMHLPTGLYIGSLRWGSGGSLGPDDQNRWQWSTNHIASFTPQV